MGDYDIGKRLCVRYTPAQISSSGDKAGESSEIDLKLEILHAYSPFTLSVVLQVRIHSPTCSPLPPSLPSICVVKIYDRRYDTNTRHRFDKDRPYSAAKEAAYQRYLLEPRDASEEEKSIGQLGREGDDGGIEACLEEASQRFFVDERRAYEDMREVQGTHIPKLYGSIRYTSSNTFGGLGGADSFPPFVANGLILEYFPAITLKEFLDAALLTNPPLYAVISAVCDQAVAVMDRLDGFSVLNRDARLENVLVVSCPAANSDTPHTSSSSPTFPSPTYRLVAIDFACTRLRHADETDEQWRRAKQSMDERGAVGLVAQAHLGRQAGAIGETVDTARLWRYSKSARWKRTLTPKERAAYEEDPEWGLYGY
ncbi:uncharacterized protein MKK02DRAFT_44570 [Dioszegia hungarica]|uniref:Protein kinase domain-containing protein n=1 Tax=Dioszegia hungarica TaxID=4972 RepID=A0AA38HBC3_9TREE|nr:uncharacterized protein MKK02DRAFT_44570 [Dioszegia hungarica]KAI9635874.1 hypothetical protein MKK02DRAFT_44570 [Dioszegia hungarica]